MNNYDQIQNKEISATRRWAIGIIIALTIQSFSVVWGAAILYANVQRNSEDIAEVKDKTDQAASALLTRQEVGDILNSRDSEIQAIRDELRDFKEEVRAGIKRIEDKL